LHRTHTRAGRRTHAKQRVARGERHVIDARQRLSNKDKQKTNKEKPGAFLAKIKNATNKK
jgi:hypothetical protein